MRIVLMNPGIAIDGFAQNGVRPKTGLINLGLCYISSALKKEGHSVSLIDLRQLFGWYELPGEIKCSRPDIVGITMMSLDYEAGIKSAKIIKDIDRNIKVVVGGVHPTVMESDLINNEYIDYIFKGEAEITLPRIMDKLAKGEIAERVIMGEKPDLDKIPLPDRNLFNILEPPPLPFLRMPLITAVTGRGCMYNCNFCQPAERKIYGPRVRRVSAGRFIEEIRIIKDTSGLNTVIICDDCFVDNPDWIEKFLTLYSKKELRKPFMCNSRVDVIIKHPGLFRDMRKYGLEVVTIGFESGSQRVLNFLRKGTTVEQNYKAAHICKKLGIRIWANFMLGIPTETKKEVLETIKMIKKINPYMPSPAFYTPFPGSDLYEFCKKNDLSLIKDYKDYERYPLRPKIKDVDYDFLKRVLKEELKVPLLTRLWRKIDRLKLGRHNKELINAYKH